MGSRTRIQTGRGVRIIEPHLCGLDRKSLSRTCVGWLATGGVDWSHRILKHVQFHMQVSQAPSIFAASTPTISPYLVASAASPAGMSFQETFGVSALQYAGRHFEMPTHEQLYSPTTHFCSATGTPDQHSPREALIMSAVHQSGMGSSGSSSVFIRTGKSSSTFFGPSSVAQR